MFDNIKNTNKENTTTITTKTLTTTNVEEDALELSLSLRPIYSYDHNNIVTKRDAQAIRRHEAKLKRDFKRKVQEDFLQNSRKVPNLGFATVAPPWVGCNGGGFQGQNGNFSSEGKDCGSGSISSGSSSGVSDNYQSISGPGSNSSDAGSHPSHPHELSPSAPSISSDVPPCSSQLDVQSNSSKPNHSKPQLGNSDSNKIELMSSSTQSTKSPEGASTPSDTNCQQNGASPNSSKDSNTTPRSIIPKEGKGETGKPPRPVVVKQQQQQQQEQNLLLSQMPCVTTTGNGPNGKTITGFLYKYTKAEVSIVCVCHGSSFSPAEFVEHAGGVDVEYPLKHIRVDPFGLS